MVVRSSNENMSAVQGEGSILSAARNVLMSISPSMSGFEQNTSKGSSSPSSASNSPPSERRANAVPRMSSANANTMFLYAYGSLNMP